MPAGSEGLLTLPHWNGAQTPHWDPQASGAVLGWRGCHTRAHFYRSLLEGITFELRLQLGRAGGGHRGEGRRHPGHGRRHSKPPVATARWPTCWAARSKGAPGGDQRTGCAAVALTSIGAYPDVASAATALVSTEPPIEPRAEVSAQYAGPLTTYRHLYQTLRPVLRTLHP